MAQKAAETQAQSPKKPAAPAPELERLNVFVGSWRAEGEAMPDSPQAGRMITKDTYEWFPGGHFLVDRGELDAEGAKPAEHIWIFGYDASSGTYPVHAFDAEGNFRVYHATVSDRTWTFTGQYERATIVFGEDGNTYDADWEFSTDGTTWKPLCTVTANRVR